MSEVKSERFDRVETTAIAETSSTAIAAQAQAQVQARYAMAIKMPRNMEETRVRLLQACKRSRFAETALYAKPAGGSKIVGPSIRFAEEALRHMRNILAEPTITYEDDLKRQIKVMVTDLESNLTYGQEAIINKTVERRYLKNGQKPISSRTNSNGDTVYLVHATEDEIFNKQNAIISKLMRNNGLRLLPSDILEECIEQINETLASAIKHDPNGEKRKVIDAFDSVGVRPSQLAEYLGHPIDQLQPSEIKDLREVYATIKDGEARWSDYVRPKNDIPAPDKTANIMSKLQSAEPPKPPRRVIDVQTNNVPGFPDGFADATPEEIAWAQNSLQRKRKREQARGALVPENNDTGGSVANEDQQHPEQEPDPTQPKSIFQLLVERHGRVLVDNVLSTYGIEAFSASLDDQQRATFAALLDELSKNDFEWPIEPKTKPHSVLADIDLLDQWLTIYHAAIGA